MRWVWSLSWPMCARSVNSFVRSVSSTSQLPMKWCRSRSGEV